MVLNYCKIKSLALAMMCGICSGLATSLFLYVHAWATKTRDQNSNVIWALPLAGLLIGWIYYRFGKDVVEGNHQIIQEIHNPKKTIPFIMVPLIFVSTILTHFFGGSAGREGTAVQMGSALADQINNLFKIKNANRKFLLVAGAGAGFAGAIGAPLAGFIFGLEFFSCGRPQLFAWAECLMASFVAYGVTLILKAPHTNFPRFQIPGLSLNILMSVILSAIVFGFAVILFIKLNHYLTKGFKSFIKFPPLRTFMGGFVILGLFHLEGTFDYVGLGLNQIITAFNVSPSMEVPFYKSIFTALTLSSGFKGGEFIPLVFIGTTLGSFLATVLPATSQLLGALGFSSVFGAASKTPLACSIMCMEIFGFEIGGYAVLSGYISSFVSGSLSIYDPKC